MKTTRPYVRGLYSAVAKALQGAFLPQDKVKGIDPIRINDGRWPGLMRKKMEIDRINTTNHKHHMNGAKECQRRIKQMYPLSAK